VGRRQAKVRLQGQVPGRTAQGRQERPAQAQPQPQARPHGHPAGLGADRRHDRQPQAAARCRRDRPLIRRNNLA